MTTTTPKRLRGPMSRRLHDARVEAGLSRKALAALIDVSERAVNYYENPLYTGKRKPIVVKAWAEATGRTPEELSGPPGQELSRRACNGGSPRARARRSRPAAVATFPERIAS